MPTPCRRRGWVGSSDRALPQARWWATSGSGPPPTSPSDRALALAGRAQVTRLRDLTRDYLDLARRLTQGGGEDRIAKVRAQGKLPARERISRLLDAGSPWFELGLLVAYDQYD